MEIRDLRPDEVPFLRQILVTALDWKPGRGLSPGFILLRIPHVSIFHARWGGLA